MPDTAGAREPSPMNPLCINLRSFLGGERRIQRLLRDRTDLMSLIARGESDEETIIESDQRDSHGWPAVCRICIVLNAS